MYFVVDWLETQIFFVSAWPKWRTWNIMWARIWSKIIQDDGYIPTSILYHITILLGPRINLLVLLWTNSNTTRPRSSDIEICSSVPEVSDPGTIRLWSFAKPIEVSSDTECCRATSVLLCPAIDCSCWSRLCVGSLDTSGLQGGCIGSFDILVDRRPFSGRIRASCEEVSQNLEWVFGRVVRSCFYQLEIGSALCSNGLVSEIYVLTFFIFPVMLNIEVLGASKGSSRCEHAV